MIEASQEFGLQFGHSNLQFSQQCRIYKLGRLLDINGQKMHGDPT